MSNRSAGQRARALTEQAMQGRPRGGSRRRKQSDPDLELTRTVGIPPKNPPAEADAVRIAERKRRQSENKIRRQERK